MPRQYAQVAERSMAAVQKTEAGKLAVGSNPTLRANGASKSAPSASWCIARQLNSSGDCEAAGVYAGVAQRQSSGMQPSFDGSNPIPLRQGRRREPDAPP